MLVYKSHFITANYLETKYLLHIQWTKPADLMDEVGYYSEVKRFMVKRLKRPGRLILWDMQIIQDRIDKKFINWIEQEVLPPLLSVKVMKIALVISNDLVREVNQGLREFANKNAEVKVFSNSPEAMQWLTQGVEPVIKGPELHHH